MPTPSNPESASKGRPYRGLPVLALLLVGASALLAGCETEPTQPDPTEVRLNDVDQRLGRVERVVNNQSLVQLSQRIDQLDMQLRELRGELEELQNANDTVTKQQRDYYTDLDRRIGALETAARAGGAAPAVPPAGPGGVTGGTGATDASGSVSSLPPGGGAAAGAAGGNGGATGSQTSDQTAYARAFDTLRSGNYGLAVQQFLQFLQSYPASDLDDNAQYWLGEGYYVMRDYDDAAAAFKAVGDKYPQSRKAPDALLKLGFTQLDQQKTDVGRATLQQVLQQFPTSDAAKLATQRLATLSQGSP